MERRNFSVRKYSFERKNYGIAGFRTAINGNRFYSEHYAFAVILRGIGAVFIRGSDADYRHGLFYDGCGYVHDADGRGHWYGDEPYKKYRWPIIGLFYSGDADYDCRTGFAGSGGAGACDSE